MNAPWRNDSVTIGCAVCGRAVPPVGRRRFCSAACRQAAGRRRQPVPPVVPAARRAPRPATIYACPACGARSLGAQRCAAGGLCSRRGGPGGPCPHCDEPVAVAELIELDGR